MLTEQIREQHKTIESNLDAALKEGDVAAFIFEPLVMGAGGMIMYSEDVLSKMIELLDRYDLSAVRNYLRQIDRLTTTSTLI